MIRVTYRHGLRKAKPCRLIVAELDLETARIWIRPIQGQPLDVSSDRGRGITARTDLGRVNPHMLRQACGYALANKEHGLRTVQDYLVHRDPKHTAVYTRTAAKRFENLWR